MAQQYQPISCAQHERLEFSVLRKIPLDMCYENTDGLQCRRVLPLDVVTRDGAEWFAFRCENGETVEIRLDAIISFQETLVS